MATDWSKDGIGFFLLQKHCTCPGDAPFCCLDGWKVTLVSSRFTHPAESRYAPIEGEALAVADTLEQTRYFVLGCDDLIVAVDHRPLLKVLSDHKLEDIKTLVSSTSKKKRCLSNSRSYTYRARNTLPQMYFPGIRSVAKTIS